MKIYNTMTRKKEEFVPLHEGKVGIYSCGPTVYNYFHIGNARPFIIFDTLRRHLEHMGYEVTFVQNFTDVDDKMIRRANEEGVTVAELGDRFIEEYFRDADALGVKRATVHPRATKHIGEIIGMTKSWRPKDWPMRWTAMCITIRTPSRAMASCPGKIWKTAKWARALRWMRTKSTPWISPSGKSKSPANPPGEPLGHGAARAGTSSARPCPASIWGKRSISTAAAWT